MRSLATQRRLSFVDDLCEAVKLAAMDTLGRNELQKVYAAMPDPEAPTAVPLPTAARPVVPGGYHWHLRQQINTVSNAQASNHMWHSARCKFSAIRTVLNVRYGSLWTAHRARTMDRPYSQIWAPSTSLVNAATVTSSPCTLLATTKPSAWFKMPLLAVP